MSCTSDNADKGETGEDRTPRVVALVVDGMGPSLLERWIDAGELPNLQALREETDANRSVFSDPGFEPQQIDPPAGVNRVATGIRDTPW